MAHIDNDDIARLPLAVQQQILLELRRQNSAAPNPISGLPTQVSPVHLPVSTPTRVPSWYLALYGPRGLLLLLVVASVLIAYLVTVPCQPIVWICLGAGATWYGLRIRKGRTKHVR